MGVLGYILATIGGLGGLVCFILVLIQMFQRGQTTLAVVCIVLFFCAGLGELIAFIYGWTKQREWAIPNIMYAWTACIVLIIVGYALLFSAMPAGPVLVPVVPR